MLFLVFFFKQKTAYEMRISDWSSDVCSSDLPLYQRIGVGAVGDPQITCRRGTDIIAVGQLCFVELDRNIHGETLSRTQAYKTIGIYRTVPCSRGQPVELEAIIREASVYLRSEEHTSELQSLMRISYAVFCLKKKNYTLIHPN